MIAGGEMAQRQLPRILIVDDHPEMARSLARLLGGDADAVTADSGVDALARIADSGRFDLVLCDVMMPGMTGIELFERVRELDPATAAAFVFTTGGVPPEVQAMLDATGARCLLKPCDFDDLRGLIASVRRDA